MSEIGVEELAEILEKDNEFLAEHYDELIQKYPGKMIAVHDGEVIAVGDREVENYCAAVLFPSVQWYRLRSIPSDREANQSLHTV
jgi:hypothetical protein